MLLLLNMKQLDQLQKVAASKKAKDPNHTAYWSFSDDIQENITAALRLLSNPNPPDRRSDVRIKVFRTGCDHLEDAVPEASQMDRSMNKRTVN